MNDRELLEAAAKAAGYWCSEFNCPDRLPSPEWDPLTDDGDAMRLAVRLKIGTHPKEDAVFAWDTVGGRFECEPDAPDPYAATRRAIVRAAAAIRQGDK